VPLRKLTESWGAFPAAHRKRLYQAVGGYVLLAGLVAAWIASSADASLKDWQSRIPAAEGAVKVVYITPQYTATSNPVAGGQPYISIIVSGLGLSAAMTDKALETLPPDVTLSFSPYAAGLPEWLKKAQEMKYETLIAMPMETGSYPKNDPGPRALSSRLSDKDNADNLKWVMEQGKGTAGVINFQGSRFLTDKKRLGPLFETLNKNKAMFIEIPETPKSQAAAIAAQVGLPYAAVDLQIDAKPTDADIRAQLAKLENIARERGYAVGIAEPYPLTFNILKTWSARAAKDGIKLAPMTVMWKNKLHHDERTDTSADKAPE
jgi:polysaccharide deacetylase 2 family uncharacterized protein YibQ